MHLSPLGDRAITIRFGTSIDEATHRRVRAVCARLDRHPIAGMVEYVPGIASITVHYDPARVVLALRALVNTSDDTPYARIVAALTAVLAGELDDPLPPSATVAIPVCYGGACGPDLEDVARYHDLTPDDVVRIHADGDYLVYMIGFLPGFPYLGGLPERIATPRRSTPRTLVPAGSVGIGGSQTGVYPIASPGGWHLIGRTPLALFDPTRNPPTLLRAGDRVRFRAISADEFHARARDA